jgi:hypothetical protein
MAELVDATPFKGVAVTARSAWRFKSFSFSMTKTKKKSRITINIWRVEFDLNGNRVYQVRCVDGVNIHDAILKADKIMQEDLGDDPTVKWTVRSAEFICKAIL